MRDPELCLNCGLKGWKSYCMCNNIIPRTHLGCDLLWHGERTGTVILDIRTKLIREMSLCSRESSGSTVAFHRYAGGPHVCRAYSQVEGNRIVSYQKSVGECEIPTLLSGASTLFL